MDVMGLRPITKSPVNALMAMIWLPEREPAVWSVVGGLFDSVELEGAPLHLPMPGSEALCVDRVPRSETDERGREQQK